MKIVSYNICSSKELIQTATIGKRRNEIILSLYIFIQNDINSRTTLSPQ